MKINLDSIVKIATLLAYLAPIVGVFAVYIYRTEGIEVVADIMQPAIVSSLQDQVKPAVKEILLENPFVTKLDENQMLVIKGWIVDANVSASKAFPIIVKRAANLEFHKWMTRTYKFYDEETGEYLRENTGVMTDEGWVILESINP